MKKLNYITLAVFAPVLILTGALGFVLPPGPMSAAPAYNVFHIAFGALGVARVLTRRAALIRGFNSGFGIIDLDQALASVLHLVPERHFQWKPGDDVLHVVIGAGLVLIGIMSQS